MSVLLTILLAVPDTLNLTLSQALNRAFSESPEVRLTQVEIEQAELEKLKAASEFYPKVSAEGGLVRLSEIPRFSLEPLGYDMEISLGEERSEQISFGIELPLWTCGRRLQGYALAGEAAELARLDSAEVRRTLRANVTELYANVRALEEAEYLTLAAQRNSSRHLETILDKYDQGLVSHLELLQAQTREAELVPELVDVREQAGILKARLGLLFNLGPDTVLVLSQGLVVPDSVSTFYSFDRVLSARPAWRQIELARKMVERQIKIKQREALPVLAVGAEYGAERSFMTNGEWNTDWSYTIGAQVPIFNGFAGYAEVKKLEKELVKLDIQKEALSSQVRFELTEAEGELKIALARLEAARMKEKEMTELLKTVKKRTAEGLASDVDLMDAELGLRKASTEKVMAERDVIVTYANFTSVVGGLR